MTTQHADLPLNRPGALIAAIPAVLGFVPEKSLVLVTVDRGELGTVMRVDLSPRLVDSVSHFADFAAAARPDAAIAVIVDGDGAGCSACAGDFRLLGVELSRVLAGLGITLIGAHVVDRVEVGGHWYCADLCGSHGTVEDPQSSLLTVAAVLDGRRLYKRRDELLDVVALANPTRAKRIGRLVRRRLLLEADARRDDPAGTARRDVVRTLTVAEMLSAGESVSDADIAALAAALTDLQVRDALLGVAISEKADAGESLWALLARTLPPPWRAEALAMLAFSAYTRGDGPLAGVALDAALRCDRTHRMAGMLDSALKSGMRPEQIRELGRTAYSVAGRLNVELPPQRTFRRHAS